MFLEYPCPCSDNSWIVATRAGIRHNHWIVYLKLRSNPRGDVGCRVEALPRPGWDAKNDLVFQLATGQPYKVVVGYRVEVTLCAAYPGNPVRHAWILHPPPFFIRGFPKIILGKFRSSEQVSLYFTGYSSQCNWLIWWSRNWSAASP